jgi:hypothetical protein
MAEEHDVAIFAQGKRAKEAGEPEDSNPFSPDFAHQFESWAAGWAEGVAPVVEPLETDDAPDYQRNKLAKHHKKEQSTGD